MGGRKTYRTATTTSNATSTTATAATATATTTGPLAALVATGALTATCSTLRLGLRRLRLASQLDRNLTLEDLLARELFNGSVGLVCRGKVHEGVANGAVGAGIHGDGGAFTVGSIVLEKDKNIRNF